MKKLSLIISLLIALALLFSCATATTATPTAFAETTPTSTQTSIPPTATIEPSPTVDPNIPEGATGKNELGWTRETTNGTEVWVPVQLVGDAEKNIHGHWYDTMGQFPLVDSKLNLIGLPDSVFMTVLAKDGFTDAISEGKLVHTLPNNIDSNDVAGSLTTTILDHLYYRYYPDRDVNDLLKAAVSSGWSNTEFTTVKQQILNGTLTYTVYVPKDVNENITGNNLDDYTQFQWNPIKEPLVVVRVPDSDLDPTKDTTIYSAGGIKLKFVKSNNVLYAITSINFNHDDNDLRMLYMQPFFL